jgi:hypothetical protein
MQTAGFERATTRMVEHDVQVLQGRAVLDDPFLPKGATSQLALLSDKAYQAGQARMMTALDAAGAAGNVLEFESDFG